MDSMKTTSYRCWYKPAQINRGLAGRRLCAAKTHLQAHQKTKEPHQKSTSINSNAWKVIKKALAMVVVGPMLLNGYRHTASADDELATFAAAGNKIGVDAQCFINKCLVETTKCANNPSCMKGLSCLAR
jgi:hypothetical protein